LELLELWQREEQELWARNLSSFVDKEKDSMAALVRATPERLQRRLVRVKRKHELEALQDDLQLKLDLNEEEYRRDQRVAFMRYEQGKKIAVFEQAKLETTLKDVKNEATRKQLENAVADLRQAAAEAARQYEAEQAEALAAKDAYEAQLKFVDYAQLFQAAELKRLRVGELDSEEEKEEDLAAEAHELAQAKPSGVSFSDADAAHAKGKTEEGKRRSTVKK